jgi:hypothetical protein
MSLDLVEGLMYKAEHWLVSLKLMDCIHDGVKEEMQLGAHHPQAVVTEGMQSGVRSGQRIVPSHCLFPIISCCQALQRLLGVHNVPEDKVIGTKASLHWAADGTDTASVHLSLQIVQQRAEDAGLCDRIGDGYEQ